jgi:hypothetical protein
MHRMRWFVTTATDASGCYSVSESAPDKGNTAQIDKDKCRSSGRRLFQSFGNWKTITFIITGLTVQNFVRVIALPRRLLLTIVPDDAFYYLQLAQSFAERQIWSVDGGISRTTGFHPLHAYLLSAWAAAFHNHWDLLYIALGMNLVFTVGAAALLCCFLQRIYGPWGALGAAPVFLSGPSLLQSTSAMEWPLAVFVTALTYFLIFCGTACGVPRIRFYTAFLLGMVGSLARSDFAVCPASITLCLGIAMLHFRGVGKNLRLGLFVTGGAVFGFLLLSAHNFLLTGQIVQTSVRMKMLWAENLGYFKLMPAIDIFRSAAGAQRWSIGLLLVLTAAALNRRRARATLTDDPFTLIVPVASCLMLLAYVLIYARNSALQMWYSANVIVAMAAILSMPISLLRSRPILRGAIVLVLVAMALRGHGLGMALRGHGFESEGPYVQQKYMLDAASYLDSNKLDGPIASWNSGILSYFGNHPIVNLDGLVNDDVFEYTRTNNIDGYLDRLGIRYVIDFPAMFEVEFLAKRSGFADGTLRARLDPVQTFRSDNRDDFWKDFTVWKLIAKR